MKKLIAFSFLSFLFMTSCYYNDSDSLEAPLESEYKPIVMSRTQLVVSIKVLEAREINRPGKIYYKSGYIFMTEQYKGVHIIDNRDVTNPTNIAFIRVPGCVDIAAKNNTLYVDNAVDLVALDISNLDNIREVSRQIKVFPELPPPDLSYVPGRFSEGNRPQNSVIVGWEKVN